GTLTSRAWCCIKTASTTIGAWKTFGSISEPPRASSGAAGRGGPTVERTPCQLGRRLRSAPRLGFLHAFGVQDGSRRRAGQMIEQRLGGRGIVGGGAEACRINR